MKNHMKIFCVNISYKTLIGTKLLRIRFDNVDRFITGLDISYYLFLKNMVPLTIGLDIVRVKKVVLRMSFLIIM